jgi:hypothetical protein
MFKKQIILRVAGLLIALILTGCVWHDDGYGHGYGEHHQGGHYGGGEQHHR